MAPIPKRTREKINNSLARFKRILSRAKSRDINEYTAPH